MNNPKVLYSRKEAASALSLGIRTLDELINDGDLAAIRVGRRVLISRDAIEAFVGRHSTARRAAGSTDSGMQSSASPYLS